MSRIKREMERVDQMRHQARMVAKQAGAVKACALHPDDFDCLLDQGDDEANRLAYAIGTNRWKDGEIDGEREEFMDAIKEAIQYAPYDCPECDRNMGRD